MSFIGNFKKESDRRYNLSITENGAIGYKTTNSSILDMNFKISSYRNLQESDIIRDFRSAYNENPILAIKWLFYVRDAREGQGERRLFRTVITDLAKNGGGDIIESLVTLIPEYGRWDDLLCLLETGCRKSVTKLINTKLREDLNNMRENKPVSLLAKWMPSENTSSPKTRAYAHMIIADLKLPARTYRKILSNLRRYIDVTEVKMSGDKWSEIDYEKVPSRANLIYKDAFLRHDTERRKEYIDSLNKGEAKINSSVLYPHDIVSRYKSTYNIDDTLENLWKNLPNLVDGNDSTIVVADGSGSMRRNIGNTTISALEVANALAIYFSERCNGEFKDKYITFSNRPRLVDLGNCDSLIRKINKAKEYSEVANTNIEAVFDLILSTAINNNMSQDEIPHNILIVSDMEFDSCVVSNDPYEKANARLFNVINERYTRAGYVLPKLIFWNVLSRTNTIPMTENKMGVVLVSGFSVNTMKMVMSNKTNPYDALLEILNSERYKAVEDAIENVINRN